MICTVILVRGGEGIEEDEEDQANNMHREGYKRESKDICFMYITLSSRLSFCQRSDRLAG